MKKKNGFTLIELLAIIVILAIIAVITVPIILNIIENSRKGAAADSALGYKDAVNKFYVSEIAKNPSYTMPNGTYTVNGANGYLTLDGSDPAVVLNVQVSGTIPSSGSLTYENNVLTEGYLVIGDYRVAFNSDGTVTTVKNTGSSSNNSNNNNGGNNQQQTGTPLTIGTDVDYSTTLNSVTLDDWKVFLSDENYTFLIYGGYLPVTAIDMDEILEYGAYSVYPQVNAYDSEVDENVKEDDFISVMLDKSNWDSLLEGTLNETISINQKSNSNTMAMASPTIELWVDSWNTKYPTHEISILYYNVEENYDEGIYQDEDGWYVYNEDTDGLSSNADLSETVGYSDSLYFPFKDTPEGTSGYFLSSKAPSISTPTPIYVYEGGSVGQGGYDDGDYAFRPVIKLPTSLLNQE